MITDTKERILAHIRSKGQVRAVELTRELKLSSVAIQKQLRGLVADGFLEKRGAPPIVFYVLKREPAIKQGRYSFAPDVTQCIADTFLSITPDGRMMYGVDGFLYWASLYAKGKDVSELATLYASQHVERLKLHAAHSPIDATAKLKGVFADSPIQKLYVYDVYSIPVFGRTKVAKLVMHAKTAQDHALVTEIVNDIRPTVQNVITQNAIDAVAFIPPTVPRPSQFMDDLEQSLNLQLPVITLAKVVSGAIPIPQKTLASTAERVINARESIYPKNTAALPYKHILLIDDVAGSGASLNETAKKLALLGSSSLKIYAFAIVGNVKGYEVIRQI